MNWSHLPLEQALSKHRAEFEALLERAGVETLFMQPVWLAGWARHLGPDSALLVAEQAGRWCAAFPLRSGRRPFGRLRLQLVEFAGAPLFDLADPPIDPELDREALLVELFGELRRRLGRWTAAELRELPVDSATERAVAAAAARAGLAHRSRTCSVAPLLDLGALDGAAPKRSKNLRSQLNRSAKRLAELGEVETRFERPAPAELESAFEQCAGVERLSWKGTGGTALLVEEPRRAFFRELWDRLAECGELAVARLLIDGAPLAYHWGWIRHRRFFSYNLAYAPEHAQRGPGTLLLDAMVRAAPELGIDVLDASRGSLTSPHGLARYRGGEREHRTHVVYGRGATGRSLGFASTVVLPRVRAAREARRRPAEVGP